jgi:hypothetical protein
MTTARSRGVTLLPIRLCAGPIPCARAGGGHSPMVNHPPAPGADGQAGCLHSRLAAVPRRAGPVRLLTPAGVVVLGVTHPFPPAGVPQ